MHALHSFHFRLLQVLDGVADADLHRVEEGRSWSIADVVAHLSDLELVSAVRIRTILAGAGETPLAALAQDAWVERVHRREPIVELLEQFSFYRRTNFALWMRLTDEEKSRVGNHPQYGPITITHAFERLIRHDVKHLAQIERIKSSLGLR